MNILEQTKINDKKYQELNNFLLDNTNINKEDLLFTINQIDNFNINDIINNFSGQYLYTTILETFLKTNNPVIIDYIFEKYLSEINEKINIYDGFSQNIISILYKNLTYNGIKTDYLIKLIFKFENLDFLSEEISVNKKINILKYMLKFNISKKFEKKINNCLKLEYYIKEKEIIKKLKLAINETKNNLEELKKNNYYSDNTNNILKLIDLMEEKKLY